MKSLLLFCFLLPLASAGFYGKKSDVINLNTESFAKEVFTSNDVWIVEFYAPWCGHCKNLAPHWEAAAKKLKGLVKVAAVDCDVESNKELAQFFQIQGFPTIKVFGADIEENPHAKGSPFKTGKDYQGQRTTDAIVSHVLRELKYFGEDVNDDGLDSFLDNKGGKVLLFTDKKKPSSLYKSLSGHFNKRLSFAQIQMSNKGSVARFDVAKSPTLLVVKDDGSTEKYEGKLGGTELIEFLSNYAPARETPKSAKKEKAPPPPPPPPKEPVFQHLTVANEYTKYCDSGICVIGFLNPNDDAYDDYVSTLKALSGDHAKYFNFLYLDGLRFSKFASAFDIFGEDLPRLVVLSKSRGLYTPFVGAFTESSISSFLDKVIRGKRSSIPFVDNIPAFE